MPEQSLLSCVVATREDVIVPFSSDFPISTAYETWSLDTAPKQRDARTEVHGLHTQTVKDQGCPSKSQEWLPA